MELQTGQLTKKDKMKEVQKGCWKVSMKVNHLGPLKVNHSEVRKAYLKEAMKV